MKPPPGVLEEEEPPLTSLQWSRWTKLPLDAREEERCGSREKRTSRSGIGPASS
jgi:hypothetical protein